MERAFALNSSAATPSCQEITVLLLDDNERFRSGLALNLRDDGHNVHEYRMPAELPALATFSGVGVVITDYQMPGTEGLAFADAFHAVHPQIPIVMVTGHWTKALQTQANARSFLQLRRKPFDYEELHNLLHELALSNWPV